MILKNDYLILNSKKLLMAKDIRGHLLKAQ